ncbi:MAG TPA: HPr kinase/phosphatase C-terminal domain-containing protein [Devosia sp.]|jgi:serine kinase of HPr protein (carbohydrate metabolism regulator)|nr:HPr kinase/phosphatase C-terminal domain-containing protein [Devosia sp.]
MNNKALNVHGTGLVLGDTGVLLRGPSGAGKSVLALSLLDRWEGRNLSAYLVSDDRVDLTVADGLLVMAAPTQIAGLIELRGRGIVQRPHRSPAPLHLVIDLVSDFTRMLEEDALVTELLGTSLARAPIPQSGLTSLGHQLLLAVEAIAAVNLKPTAP